MATVSTVCKHLLVHGRVQGVYYRASMVQEARRLGLAGWVRNRREGAVEAMARGDAAAIAALVEWAHRGPVHARVERVDVTEPAQAPGAEVLPDRFEQRETV